MENQGGKAEMSVIVCATRGGEASRLLQTRAVEIARQRNADLVFVYVVNPNSTLDLDQQLLPAISQEMTWFANAILDIARLRGKRAGVRVETTVRRGDVQLEIEKVLKEYAADLLVIGSSRPDQNGQFSDGQEEKFAHRMAERTGVEVQIIRQKPATSE
jgi:nucleotide-binding universal stress UspA family protein